MRLIMDRLYVPPGARRWVWSWRPPLRQEARWPGSPQTSGTRPASTSPSGHHRVCIDPPGQPGEADAVVSWWVVDAEVGGPLEATLADAVPSWLGEAWPFTRVRYGV
jgi:hypothetical protein